MTLSLSRRSLLMAAGAAIAPLELAWAQAAPASAADAAFQEIAARALAGYLELDPISATSLGEHRHDAEVSDLSPEGWRRRSAFARSMLTELEALPKTELSRANQIDAALLETNFRSDIWSIETLQSWAWDPLIHNGSAGGALYGLIAREFAPLPERLASATARMEKFPALLAGTRASIQPARVSEIHATTVASQNAGLTGLIDMIAGQASVLDEAGRARLEAAAATARAAVAEHQSWIDTELVPNARGDFRIGAALYDAKLAFALNSPLDRAEIRRRAEAALASMTDEMYVLARGVLNGRADAPATPDNADDTQKRAAIGAALELAYAEKAPRDGVVPFAEQTLRETTDFVRSADLVSLPDEPLQIILMPEFQRGVAVAYCDSPGPLDRGMSTFYAVSPIPDDWTAEQADSFLREYNTRSIHELTIHEAMPGHYLQLAHANRYPSVIRAVLQSGPFIEGWGCYAQDIMADAGYLGGDPLYKLVHLKWQLRMVANAILDQGVHVDGMSREEAMTLMVDKTFQQEREAAGKWVRAQLSSAQLPTYFVGWAEHRALRAEIEAREGPAFDQKRYHDTVLSFGSPPVRYVRQLMLNEAIA